LPNQDLSSAVVTIETESIIAGEDLVVVFGNVYIPESANVSIDFARVSDYWDLFALGTGLNLASDTDRFVVSQTESLTPGIYFLRNISIGLPDSSEFSPGLFQSSSTDYTLFEVRRHGDVARNRAELISKYKEIVSNRDVELMRGIGDSNSPGCLAYRCLVFLKDCLITTGIRLRDTEIIPFEGLGCEDQFQSMSLFCEKYFGIQYLDRPPEFIARAKQNQPVAVVHFPRIYAKSPDEAWKVVESRVAVLCDVLSINRSGYATVFGSVILDSLGHPFYRIDLPHYAGNLIGGELAGESPDVISNWLDSALASEQSQLYLSLFREALLEQRIEFAYFRYWNILETVARARNYIGQPLRDWVGTHLHNSKGQPRSIADSAEELVFEHLRVSFNASGLTPVAFGSGLMQEGVEKMIPIWYRHRNCVVHSGGCHFDNESHCSRVKDKYVNCKAAHDEIVSIHGERVQFTDEYFRVLKDITKLVVLRELR
jgi:hypothetical protein